MAITLKQFDGSTVTPTDDAIMNQLIIGASGIIEGCVPTWLGTNQIKVSAGRGIAMGRQFTVDETIIFVTLTGGSKGRLLINIDTGNSVPGSFVSQAAGSLPALVQGDINHGSTVYQIPICTYDVGALAISNMVDVRSLLVGPTVINHSADKITSGTLPLTRGGTGATSAAGALSSIGALPKSGGAATGPIQFGDTIAQNVYAKFIANSSGDYFGLHADSNHFYLHKQSASGSILGSYITIRPDGSMRLGGQTDVTSTAISAHDIKEYEVSATVVGGFLFIVCDAKFNSDLGGGYRNIITVNSSYYTSSVDDKFIYGPGYSSGGPIIAGFNYRTGEILVRSAFSISSSAPFYFNIMIPLS